MVVRNFMLNGADSERLLKTVDFIEQQSESRDSAGLFPCHFIQTVKGTYIGGI